MIARRLVGLLSASVLLTACHLPDSLTASISTPSQAAAAGTAVAALAELSVKGTAPKTGYSRAQFGMAWTDDNGDPVGHNRCDTRTFSSEIWCQ